MISQQFFRESADAWIEYFAYKEAEPQLLLQAFYMRILTMYGAKNKQLQNPRS